MARSIRVEIIGDASSLQKAFSSAIGSAAGFGAKMQSVGSSITSAGKTLTAGLTLPLVGLGTLAVKAASDFESSFAGVRKTVDATEPELQALAQGFRDMAKEIPVSVNELNAIGEAAGALGIEKENILSFTRTVADLGEATDLTSEQAADAFARFANITQMPQTEFQRLGSTVVDLGNKLAATESEIVAMGTRLAGAGAQVGMTEADIMGLAAALTSVGIEAEAGGTAMSTVMIKIAAAVNEGGAAIEGFAKVAGMSSAEFKRAWEQDAAGALVTFIEGLGRIKKEGGDVFGTLDKLGLGSIRVRDALLRASGAGDLFRKSLQIAEEAWRRNNALTEEAVKRYQTFASQLTIFKNKLIDVGITFGQALMPFLTKGLEMLDPWIQKLDELANKFKEMTPAGQEMVLMIAGIAAAIGPALIVVGSLIRAFGTIATVVAGLFTPLGLVVAGIAGLAGALLHSAGGFDAILPLAKRFMDWVGEVGNLLAQGKIEQALRKIGDGIKDVARAIVEKLQSINWGQVADTIVGGITDAIGAINWGSVLSTLADIGASILRGIASAIRGVNWGELTRTLTTGLGDALRGAGKSGGLISAAGEVASAIVAAVVDAIGGINWMGLATGIGAGFESLLRTVFGDAIVNAILQGIANIGDALGAVIDGFAELYTLGGLLPDVAASLGGLLPDPGDIRASADELHNWADRVRMGTQGAEDMAAQIQDVVSGLALFGPQVDRAAATISSGLAPGMAQAVTSITTFQDGLSDAELALVGFVGTMGTVPDEKTLTMMLQDEQFVSGLTALSAQVGMFPPETDTEFKAIVDQAMALVAAYQQRVEGVPPDITTQVSTPGAAEANTALDMLIEKGGRVPPEARTQVSAPGAPETSTALDNIIQRAEKTKIPVVVKVTSPGAQEAIGNLEKLKTALGNIGTAIPAATRSFDQLKTGITRAVGEAVSEMKSAEGKFKSAATAAGKGAVAGMKSGIAGLDQAARSEAGRAVSALRGMVGQFSAVGAAMGSGVRAGFQSTIAGLASQAAAAVSAAVAAARAAAQVGSPSRAMSEGVGRPLGEGLIVGFLNGARDLPTTVSDKVREALERAKQTVDNYKSTLETAFGDLISNALSGFDRITSEHLTKTEQLIQNMELDRQIQELAQRVADAKAALDAALASGDAAAVLSAQQQLEQAMYDQKMFALRQQAEQERKDYEDRRELQRKHLEEQLNKLMESLAKHPEQHDKIQKKIIGLLKRYGVDYRGAGINVGLAIAEGLRQSIPAVTSAAQAVAQAIANALKTASPTKEGPMRDLDHWLDGFAPAYLQGLDDERIRKALASATMIGRDMPAVMYAPAAGITVPNAAGIPAGGQVINIGPIYVQGSVTTETDLADAVRRSLISKGQGLTRIL